MVKSGKKVVVVDFSEVRNFGNSGLIPGTFPDHFPLKSLCCEF